MKSTLGRLSRVAALAVTLATPALTTAYAFDPFGGDESIVLQSARSALYKPSETPLARATAEAQARSSAMAANRSGNATDAARGSVDLIGQGGRQDEIAREIYHPGTTVGTGG